MRSIIANISIIFVILLNFISSHLGLDMFDYNWLVGSLICCLLLLLDDNNLTKAFGISSALIFVYLIIDKYRFDQFHFRVNDAIGIALSSVPILLYLLKGKANSFNPDLLILLCAIGIKILAENLVDSKGQLLCIRMFGENRSYYELLGNFSLLLISIYLARNLKAGYFMPFLFIAFMAVEQSEYISNDPYHFELHEGLAISVVFLILLAAKKVILRFSMR